MDHNAPNPISTLRRLASQEPFARLLKLDVIEIRPGSARVQMKVDFSKLNIHGITHGGALFALVDEAFELASNSHGQMAVALNMNISFFAPTRPGDTLVAEATELNRTPRTATYQIHVENSQGEKICTCMALVYRKKAPIPSEMPVT